MSVCLSVCLIPGLNKLSSTAMFFRKHRAHTARIPRAVRIDHRQPYKKSGPTFGFNGVLNP